MANHYKVLSERPGATGDGSCCPARSAGSDASAQTFGVNDMKKIIAVGLIFASSFYLTVGNAKDKIIEGIISEYECGDNCYLTIIDAGGKEHIGLCTASLCQKWNEKVEMPAKFKGKKVRITVGKGLQYDAGGNVMGEMDAFKKIDLLKR